MAISWDAVSESEYYPSYVQHPGYTPPGLHEAKLIKNVSSITWSWDPKGDNVEYEIVDAPVGTPYIGRGSHRNSMTAHGIRIGCTMELVSALAGEAWTDHPRTAHPTLTRLMINTNDILPDGDRQKMLELVPRLLNTNMAYGQDLYDLILRSHHQAYALTGRAMHHGLSPAESDLLLHNAQHLLDEFDGRLNRPTGKMDDRTLTRLMMALAA